MCLAVSGIRIHQPAFYCRPNAIKDQHWHYAELILNFDVIHQVRQPVSSLHRIVLGFASTF